MNKLNLPVTPARFLFASIGTFGDLYPILNIARTLADRGHDVIVLSSQDFCDTIKSYGLKFHPILDENYYLNILKFDGAGTAVKVSQKYLVEQPIRPLYKAAKQLLNPGKTIMLCTIASAYSSRTIADALRIPSIIVHFNPIGMMSMLEPARLDGSDSIRKLPKLCRRFILNTMLKFMIGPTVLRSLNKFRSQVNLKRMKSKVLYNWMNSGLANTPQVLCLGLFPDWYAKPLGEWSANRTMIDLPQNAKLIHFSLNDNQEKNYKLPKAITDFLQKHPKPVIFTFGTRVAKVTSILNIASQTCEMLNLPAIFLCQYADSIPAKLPTSILTYHYIPLGSILKHASLLVHHGGVGTTVQAFNAAIPQIIRPTMGDQFDNSARVIKLGVGEEILPKKYNVKNLTNAIRKIMNNYNYYKINGKDVQLKMQDGAGEKATKTACNLIEDFATKELRGLGALTFSEKSCIEVS